MTVERILGLVLLAGTVVGFAAMILYLKKRQREADE